jgi:TonB family protein
MRRSRLPGWANSGKFSGVCSVHGSFLIVCLLSNALLLFAGTATAQSSFDRGTLQGRVYTNQFLRFSWTLPEDWAAQQDSSPPNKGRNYTLLRLAPGGPRTDEYIVLTAQDFTDTPGFGYEYMDKLKAIVEGQGWKTLGERSYRSLGGGLRAERDTYQSGDEPPRYMAVIAAPSRGYEIKFVISAGSPERLEELVWSAVTLKITPDWEAPASSSNPPSDEPVERVRISEKVSQLLILRKVQPRYPTVARQAHVQGSVVMTARISKEGRMKRLDVMEGDPVLAQAALEAVSQWQYKPYVLEQKPVEVETQITVKFFFMP